MPKWVVVEGHQERSHECCHRRRDRSATSREPRSSSRVLAVKSAAIDLRVAALRPRSSPAPPPSRSAMPQYRRAQICDTLKRETDDRRFFVLERCGGLNGAVVCVTRCMADAVRVATQSRQGCATKHQPPRPATVGAPIPVDRADAELLRCAAGAEIDRAGHHMDRVKPRAARPLLFGRIDIAETRRSAAARRLAPWRPSPHVDFNHAAPRPADPSNAR